MNRPAARRWLIAVIGGVSIAASSACLQPSLNPLFEPEDARVDSRLEGAWTCNEAGTETWTFHGQDANRNGRRFKSYDVTIKEADESGDLDAILGRLGTHDFLSFAADGDPKGLPRFAKRQYLAIYTFGRVVIEPDRVTISMMPADWGSKHKDDVAFGLGAVQGEDAYVLTAPTKALQSLVLAHANDEDAFKQALVLVRPGKTGGTCYSEK